MISIPDLFAWWYVRSVSKIYNFSIATVKYIYHFFSIPYLLSTLFVPWKRDISQPANPNLQEKFNAFINNIVARIMGFIVRSITIFAGIIIILLSIIGLAIFIILWLLWPILTIASLVNAILIVI